METVSLINLYQTTILKKLTILLLLKQDNNEKKIPVNIKVDVDKESKLTIDVKPTSLIITPGKRLGLKLNMYNPLEENIYNVRVEFEFIDSELYSPR